MAPHARQDQLKAIEDVVQRHPEGLTAHQIAAALSSAPPRRTLQYRLKSLVDSKRLMREGEGRWARYRVPNQIVPSAAVAESDATAAALLPMSALAAEIQRYVRQPLQARKPVGYDRAFLESYRPGETFYLTASQRTHLRAVGTPKVPEQPAGTYAKQILNRVLIDLSWNSSRLEGNTYSLLDTKHLIESGGEAVGKPAIDAQMILNHKEAIEFLVGSTEGIGLNRYTLLNLHALLANNLLDDPAAAGRLRFIPVGIEQSVFHPLEAPQLIQECFDQLLATASAIADPFEQAFFAMVQLPYLQPFDDVNRRVSRLAANIPLFKGNLSPLSFAEVPRETYIDAMLGIYELNRIDMLRDLFIWAYERSAARYVAVRQSLGEPDPFRLRHRAALRDLIAEVIRERMDKERTARHVENWTAQHIEEPERERFRDTAERELLALHEGNFARYQVRPSEFAAWRTVWEREPERAERAVAKGGRP